LNQPYFARDGETGTLLCEKGAETEGEREAPGDIQIAES